MALGRPLFTGFDDFFEPHPWVRDPLEIVRAMEEEMIHRDPFFVRSSPGYQIHSTETSWDLVIDVPGVESSDLELSLEQNGRLLHLSGSRKMVKENQATESITFDKRFTIGDDIETSQISANLNAGVLKVTAPKKEKREVQPVNIPITESPRVPEPIDVVKSSDEATPPRPMVDIQ